MNMTTIARGNREKIAKHFPSRSSAGYSMWVRERTFQSSSPSALPVIPAPLNILNISQIKVDFLHSIHRAIIIRFIWRKTRPTNSQYVFQLDLVHSAEKWQVGFFNSEPSTPSLMTWTVWRKPPYQVSDENICVPVCAVCMHAALT